MSRRANFTSNIINVHRRVVKDLLAQFARHRRGRYVWSPGVRRHIADNTPLYQQIEKQAKEAAANVSIRDRKNDSTGV